MSGLEKHMRVEAVVDLDAIRFNMDQMHSNLKPGTRMTAVIKTDGYGHGAVPIAHKLEDLDYIWGYATATIEEAMELRQNDISKPILILGYVFPDQYADLIKYQIRPATFREDMLEQLDQAAKEQGRTARVHIAVDTGMSRIGIRPDDQGLSFVRKALSYENIEIEGMFTHFAKADMTSGKEATDLQFSRFHAFAERIEEELGYRIPIIHCSNSAALIERQEMNLDMVRAGITLYGLWPSGEVRQDIVELKPALSLHSHISYIKTIHAGEAVSYGGTFVADHDTRIATVPVGYGDGYPRSLSGRGYVLIHGKKAYITGRVCMDQFMVNIDDIPEVKEGDLVTLIGRDGEENISCEELGELSGRFNYELCCDLNKRVPRRYLG